MATPINGCEYDVVWPETCGHRRAGDQRVAILIVGITFAGEMSMSTTYQPGTTLRARDPKAAIQTVTIVGDAHRV